MSGNGNSPNSVTVMNAKRVASEALVAGGVANPNEDVVHDGEPSSPSPGSGQTIGFSKILEIDVVMEELLQYLSVREMKVLSSVSKDALIAIRKSKVFSGRVRFRICEDSIRSRVLDNCFYSWKSVIFDIAILNDKGLADCVPDSSTILQSLGSVQWLSIEERCKFRIDGPARSKINDFILKIIESSKETLEELKLLELHAPSFHPDVIESIRCPNLKRLEFFKHRGKHDDIVVGLLRNLPPLEKLIVPTCCLSKLFSGLQGRMSKLRELDICIERRSRKDCTLPRNIDWNEVADMTRLENVHIFLGHRCCRTCVQEVEQLLVNIPAKTVTSISAHEFSDSKKVRFSRKLGEHISRFENLTELNLGLKGFDDDSLQCIIKGCQKLKNVRVDCVRNLTDFGFSGIRSTPNGERGVSLANLKDLTTLTIRWCDPLKMATLLAVIRFEHLNSLYLRVTALDFKTQSVRQFLFQILQQNPSLTEIDVGIDKSWPPFNTSRDRLLEDEAKTRYSRIRKIEFSYAILKTQRSREPNEDDSDSDGSDDI